jgi:superfamily II DNA or RNA helicase
MSAAFAPGDLVRARGREWVALPSPRDGWLSLRPLSGSETSSVLLDPVLEIEPVEPARFDLPADARMTVQANALLLADALRLTLRRGAGPFRSAAQIAFEPRIYQLVPLLMALRLSVPRLLIADDVGIGKTVEAGLILRELMDRGEIDSFSVLCPPHLVDQWTGELANRFGIDAVAVTASSAARLERGLPVAQTLFDAHPVTVVSLDYIKADKRRDAFARACPRMIVVDEAHACVGTHQGRQQRFELLSALAKDPERAILMLTATPHSGDEEAFGRLLSLIQTDFASLSFDDARFRERLARHFVQRRRIDLTSGEWAEEHAFPKHDAREATYRLSKPHLDFQEAVLDYCFGVVARVGGGKREQRLAFWGTLALMRCIGSSPAAALSALRNRAVAEAERLEPQLYDDDGEDGDAVDVEPATSLPVEPALASLIGQAERLMGKPDPKLEALRDLLGPLVAAGANPVVFCRFIATAEHVRDALRKAFPKVRVEAVTGLLTPDERRDRVVDMATDERRILVATDCLSEGINLQQLFDAVVHYDLSWNPTRHQQREGRVDRFGQPSPEVHSVLMYSPDSAIDGAVLEVILRKAEKIRKATGVTVPLPDEKGPVTDALMAAMMLRRTAPKQLALDLRLQDGSRDMEQVWRKAEESERRSRSRFAQNAMKPQEVAPEWAKARALLGDAGEAVEFVRAAMTRFNAPLEQMRTGFAAHLDALDSRLRERLEERGLSGTLRLAGADPVPAGATLLTRTHALTTTLGEALVEGALDPDVLPGLGLGRAGAWPTPAVTSRSLLALLRMRFKLTVHARRERLLLAEGASLVALANGKVTAAGTEARKLLAVPAAYDLAATARERTIRGAQQELPALLAGPLSDYARQRAADLLADHNRLRAAATGVSRVTVEPVLPPDGIGLFVLLPSGA